MDYETMIQTGLNGSAPLKVILCGNTQTIGGEKKGVVSMVYATMDRDAAESHLRNLIETDSESYYMVYSVPLDTELNQLPHYPSIEISKDDLT